MLTFSTEQVGMRVAYSVCINHVNSYTLHYTLYVYNDAVLKHHSSIISCFEGLCCYCLFIFLSLHSDSTAQFVGLDRRSRATAALLLHLTVRPARLGDQSRVHRQPCVPWTSNWSHPQSVRVLWRRRVWAATVPGLRQHSRRSLPQIEHAASDEHERLDCTVREFYWSFRRIIPQV